MYQVLKNQNQNKNKSQNKNQNILETKNEKGATLVLLPGWGFHAGVFESLLKSISETKELQHIHCFPLNLPIIHSPYNATHDIQHDIHEFHEPTLSQIAEVILAQVPPQAIWLGWSLGGLIAQWVAIHYPHRVKALISVSSSPRFLEEPNWPGMSVEYFETFRRKLKQNVKKNMMEFVMLNTYPNHNKQNILFLREVLFSVPLPNLKTLEYSLEILKITDLRSIISKIKCPNLYLFGENDCLVNMKNAFQIKKMIPNGKFFIFKGEGHIPFISSEKQFISILCSFLETKTNNLSNNKIGHTK